MALATLSIDLVAKLGELQAGMDKAGRIAAKSAAEIEARWSKLSSAASGIGVALGGAISIAGLTTFFRATVDGLDKLNDLSDATGATVENLSALEDIAARTGTSVDTVGDALVKMNQFLTAASKPGSVAADALKSIGLNAEELKRIDPAVALQKVAVALSGYANDGNKARLVQELFGKSIREVAPLLNDLAAGGELNARVTAEQALEAEKFNKQLSAFAKNAQDAARAITSELLPSLNRFLVGISALTKLGSVGFTGVLAEVLKGNTFEDAGRGVIFYTEKLANLQKQRDIIARDSNPVARRGGLLDIDTEIGKVKELQAFYRALFSGTAADNGQTDPLELARRGRAGLKFLASTTPDGKPTKAPTAQAPRFELDEATRNALRAIETTDVQKIAELQRTLAKLLQIDEGSPGDPSDPAVAQAINAVRKALADLDPKTREAAESQKRLADILAATPSGQMQALREEAEFLAKAMRETADPALFARLYEGFDGVRERMEKLSGVVAPVTEEVSEFARQAGRNIQDALGDTLLQTLDGKFESIGQLWGQMLKRMVAQAAAVQLGEFLLGDFGKTGKIGGVAKEGIDWLKNLPAFAGFFASGGTLGAGQWGIAGEAGPEVVRGPASITPMGGGGGPSITYAPVFNFTDASAEQVGRIRAVARAEYTRFARQMSIQGAT